MCANRRLYSSATTWGFYPKTNIFPFLRLIRQRLVAWVYVFIIRHLSRGDFFFFEKRQFSPALSLAAAIRAGTIPQCFLRSARCHACALGCCPRAGRAALLHNVVTLHGVGSMQGSLELLLVVKELQVKKQKWRTGSNKTTSKIYDREWNKAFCLATHHSSVSVSVSVSMVVLQ